VCGKVLEVGEAAAKMALSLGVVRVMMARPLVSPRTLHPKQHTDARATHHARPGSHTKHCLIPNPSSTAQASAIQRTRLGLPLLPPAFSLAIVHAGAQPATNARLPPPSRGAPPAEAREVAGASIASINIPSEAIANVPHHVIWAPRQ